MIMQMEVLNGFETKAFPATEAVEAQNGQPEVEAAPAHVELSWRGQAFATVFAAEQNTLASQVEHVISYVDQRGDRAAEVVAQVGGTVPFFLHLTGIPAARARHLLELLAFVEVTSGLCVMTAKHALACRRPDELDSRILPLIPTPAHGSLPSGHATQAAAIAKVLNTLLDEVPQELAHRKGRSKLIKAQAHRIAVNRTVAGLHYPMDSYAGTLIGSGVASIIIAMAKNRMPTLGTESYNPNASHGDDFYLRDAMPLYRLHGAVGADLGYETTLSWLWEKAREDIKHLATAP